LPTVHPPPAVSKSHFPTYREFPLYKILGRPRELAS